MARTYRTLQELREQTRAACGFGASGAVAGANQLLIDQKLQLAQTVLYNSHDWAHLRRYETKTIGMHQTLVDYPATADQDRIKAISVFRGDVWSRPLPRGIQPEWYTTQLNYSWPQRWEPYEQIEVWPSTDQAYDLRIFFIRQCDDFTQDGDRASVDDTAVLLGAIAMAKAHYRQPDAEMYVSQWQDLLTRLKARSWGKSIFNPDDYAEEPLVRPVTV
jgi:hypothetical protein